MEIADIAAEHLQGVHRVALAVHEQVGRVKVDAQVAGVDFLDDAEQDDGRLLAGLEPESQAALLAVDSDFADGVNDWWVFRVSHVFGDEAAVRDDGRCANHAGKVSAALQVDQPLGAILRGHQSKRSRAFREIPLGRRAVASPESADVNAGTFTLLDNRSRHVSGQQV